LMEEGLSTIIVAIRLSRKIFQRMKNYLTYRVASSLMLAVFFVISVAAFNPIEHLGCGTLIALDKPYDPADPNLSKLCASTTTTGLTQCLPPGTEETCQIDELSKGQDVVVDLNRVAIPDYFLLNILQLVFMIMFNDICMITVAWDNVRDSNMPKTWDMRRLYTLSAVLCVAVAAMQLLYLVIGYAAMLPIGTGEPAPMNLFYHLGYHKVLQFSEMETMMYISLSWAGFLTLLACRNEGFFWESLPGKELAIAFVISIGATTLLGVLLKVDSIAFWAAPPEIVLLTLVWNVLAFFLLDFVKALTIAFLDRLEGKTNPLLSKTLKMTLWAQNRATLASRATGEAERPSRPTGGEPSTRASRSGVYASTSSAVGARGEPDEVERLQAAVAKLAGLVGAAQPEAKGAVAEILASLRD